MHKTWDWFLWWGSVWISVSISFPSGFLWRHRVILFTFILCDFGRRFWLLFVSFRIDLFNAWNLAGYLLTRTAWWWYFLNHRFSWHFISILFMINFIDGSRPRSRRGIHSSVDLLLSVDSLFFTNFRKFLKRVSLDDSFDKDWEL